MHAVVLTEYTDPPSLSVAEVPRPTPKPGEVLVKVAFAPINPSDLEFVKGTYAYRKPLPAVPGFEASGVVQQSGGGFLANLLVGRLVAVRHSPAGFGTWAEFVVCPVENCTVLHSGVDLQQAACMFINPMTALLFRETALAQKSPAVVQNAATSALGRMVRRLLPSSGVAVINIVRSATAAEHLRAEGEQWVIDSSQADFEPTLKRLCTELHAKVAFDAVGGNATGALLRAVEDGGTVFVYGLLSGAPSGDVSAADLLFHGKRVEGLWMPVWLKAQSTWRKLRLSSEVQSLLSTTLRSDVAGTWSLSDAAAALTAYLRDMSAGKVLLAPSSSP